MVCDFFNKLNNIFTASRVSPTNRNTLLAWHKNYLSPFLPLVGLYFSGIISFTQLFLKTNSEYIISVKKWKSISFLAMPCIIYGQFLAIIFMHRVMIKLNSILEIRDEVMLGCYEIFDTETTGPIGVMLFRRSIK